MLINQSSIKVRCSFALLFEFQMSFTHKYYPFTMKKYLGFFSTKSMIAQPMCYHAMIYRLCASTYKYACMMI